MLTKALGLAALVTLWAAPMPALTQTTQDEEAIKALIQSAYVDGLQNLGDLEKTRAGFHPDFVLLGLRDAAVAKFELYREGEHIFTDYMTLYQFPDGWKIVGKIYFRDP